ncbi:MAG: 3-phosphoshikimate 1-carboxyvinyltransferase [Arsenophonus sp.]|nr:MAG: 3-phosphoshikimate 1-carboxyvinyltransferase [Arsenophonus sp.]
MNYILIPKISYINGSITLPGSKSISNRVLLLSALSKGITKIENLLKSDDTYHMLMALKKLGIQYTLSKKYQICKIKGIGNHFNNKKNITIFIGNAGTVLRPLTALLSLGHNDIILIGNDQMNNRPIKYLVDSLRQGGAKIKYLDKNGYPPIRIYGGYIGGKIKLNGNISSQFLTGLLIQTPLSDNDTIIEIKNSLVSKPYVRLTILLMKKFGIKIYHSNYSYFYIQGKQQYISPGHYVVEGDATSATYFLASAAIKGGTVRTIGINQNSIQGDIKFFNILKSMGSKILFGHNYIECSKNRLIGLDIDMNDYPDSAMTLSILALFAVEKSIIRNIHHWVVKESNRLYAISHELKKIGVKIKIGQNYIEITPPKHIKSKIIETYNDHRIAMCFSLLSLNKKIILSNPKCVNKSFPNYFLEFNRISHRKK